MVEAGAALSGATAHGVRFEWYPEVFLALKNSLPLGLIRPGPSLSIRPTGGHRDSFGEWPGIPRQYFSNLRNSSTHLKDRAKSQPRLLCSK